MMRKLWAGQNLVAYRNGRLYTCQVFRRPSGEWGFIVDTEGRYLLPPTGTEEGFYTLAEATAAVMNDEPLVWREMEERA